jgi:hypothetical protein
MDLMLMFDRDLDLRAPTQETGFFNGGKRLLRSIFVKKTRFLLESGRFSITITFFSRSLFTVKSRLGNAKLFPTYSAAVL